MSKIKRNAGLDNAEYVPAQISNGQIVRVYYYAKDPMNGRLRRVVVKCNRPRLKRDKLIVARQVMMSINEKLARGWNPFVDRMVEDGEVCFGVALEWFLEEKGKELRPDSLRSYRSLVEKLRGWLESEGALDRPVRLWQEAHCGRFLTACCSGLANKTYNTHVKFYRSLWNWFSDNRYCDCNPWDMVKVKRVDSKYRDIIPQEVRQQIRDYLTEEGEDGFLQCCLMCYRMLIRPKEMLMLKVGDVGTDTIRIRAEVAKNHNERIVAIPEDMRGWFSCLKGHGADELVFAKGYRPGRTAICSRDIGRAWGDMRKALGFSKAYTFYSLKDTGITEMLERGVPPKLVKELADHHSLEMTERYTHRSDAKKILEYDALRF